MDAQSPIGGVDLGHDERRVDAVERRVRRDDGRESRNVELRTGGEGRRGHGGGGQPQGAPHALHRDGRRRADAADDRGTYSHDDRARRPEQEGAPTGCRGPGLRADLAAVRLTVFRRAGGSTGPDEGGFRHSCARPGGRRGASQRDQEPKREDARRSRECCGNPRARGVVGAQERRHDADDAEPRHDDDAPRRTPQLELTRDCRDDDQDERDAGDEGDLVGRAEEGDRGVLRPRRGQVDEATADGSDGTRLR